MYTHVVFVNKSVLRVDLFAYHPRLRSAESLREYNNILAYFVQVGLVDITKAGQQVMIYELTRAIHHGKSRAKHTVRLNHVVHHLATVITSRNQPCFASCARKPVFAIVS